MSAEPLPDGVRLTDGRGGRAMVAVEGPAGSAQVYLTGAHILGWRPAGHEPVLWTSDRAVFSPGAPIRGGIPLCAPWFVFGRSQDREPLHGFFQFVPWRLASAQQLPTGIRLRLTMDGQDARAAPGAAGFPARFDTSLVVDIGAELTIAWTVRSLGDPLEVEQAMHTHLTVGDITRARVEGLDGAGYLDKVTGRSGLRQRGALEFASETDRVYQSTAEVTLVDPALRRRVRLSRLGSAQTVVWNPWADKAATMDDFGDTEWRHMVCLESANVLDRTPRLGPGEQHTVTTRLTVEAP